MENTPAVSSEIVPQKKPNLDSVSHLFKCSFRLYKEHFFAIAKIFLVPLPFILLSYALNIRGSVSVLAGVFFGIVGQLILLVATNAVLFSVAQSTNLKESYRKSLAIFLPYIWVMILFWLAMMGGYVMLLIPAFIMGIWFTFSRMVVVLEGKRGMNALTQSREYIRGYWWPVCGRFFLFWLSLVVPFVAIFLPSMILTGKLHMGAMAGLGFNLVIWMLIMPFSVIYTYEMYRNLVVIKPERVSSQAVSNRKFFIASAIIGAILIVTIPVLVFVFVIPAANKSRGNALAQEILNVTSSVPYSDGVSASSARFVSLEEKPYVDLADNISIRAPKGWTVNNHEKHVVVRIDDPAPPQGAWENIVVDRNLEAYSPQQYAATGMQKFGDSAGLVIQQVRVCSLFTRLQVSCATESLMPANKTETETP